MEFFLVLSWVMLAVIVGVAASRRYNRIGFLWFLLSLPISPMFAGLFLIAVGPKAKPMPPPIPPVVNWRNINWQQS